MSFISRSEVKNILRISDNYVENESIIMSSMSPKKLVNKGNVNIIYVAADDDNSTEHTTYYTTSADYKTTKDPAGYTLIKKFSTSSTIGDTATIYVRYLYNEYDTYIDMLIPQIRNDLCEYLNNYFIDKQTQYSGSHFQYVSGTTDYIRDTEKKFLIEGFQSGMDVLVEGSYRNSGIYTISSASSEYLKLSANDTLLNEKSTDEFGGKITRISRIDWPIGLKKTVAKIIWANLDRAKSDNIKSKSIGPTAITYASVGGGGYDETIYHELRKYKKVSMK